MQKIISLNFFPSFCPPMTGGERRAFHIMQSLAKHVNVVSLTPTYSATRDEALWLGPRFTEYRFTKTRRYQEWHWHFDHIKIGARGSDLALALSVASHTTFVERFKREIVDADAVVYQHPSLAPMLDVVDHRSIPVFYLSHNCEFDLVCQNTTGDFADDYRQMIFQMEHRLCTSSDGIFAVSDEDRAKFIALYGIHPERVEVVPNGAVFNALDAEAPIVSPVPRQGAVFVGSNWPANNDAARHIVEGIAPLVPEIDFTIVGSTVLSLPSEVKMGPNVRLCPEVADDELRAIYQSCDVALNPTLKGGGSNVKVAEYLASGLRILTTPVGARGYRFSLPNLHICEITEFAGVLSAITKVPVPDAEREAWIAKARGNWDWDAISNRLFATMIQASLGQREYGAIRRLLVLNEFGVQGASNGGQARINGLYSQPDDDMWVTILSFGRDGFQSHVLGPRTVCLEIPTTQAQDQIVKEENRGAYASVNDIVYPTSVDQNPLWMQVFETVAANTDLISFEHPFMLPCFERSSVYRPYIYSSHNVEATLKTQALRSHRKSGPLIAEVTRQERELVETALAVASCSPNDDAIYRRMGASIAKVFPNGVTRPAPDLGRSGMFDGNIEPRRRFYVWDPSESDKPVDEEFIARVSASILKCDAGSLGPALTPQDEETRASWTYRIVSSDRNRAGNRIYVMGLPAAAGLARPLAVFLGSGHRPNLTAAELLVSVVAPQVPDVDIGIIGSVWESMNLDHAANNVFVFGRVSDEDKSFILRNATIGLNPMVDGGGSNLKVPDYLAHGLPVLSTEFGARGFDLGETEGLFSSHILDFADKLTAVLRDSGLRSATSIDKYRKASERYEWNRISKSFFALIGEQMAALQNAKGTGDPVIAVVEDEGLLVNSALTGVFEHLQAIAATLPLEVVVQRNPLNPSVARPNKQPGAIPVTVSHLNIEHELENRSQPRYGSSSSRLLNVFRLTPLPHKIPYSLHSPRPVLLSGWSDCIAGTVRYRFIWQKGVIAVNGPGRIGITGHAIGRVRLQIFDGSNEVHVSHVEKAFFVSIDINGPIVTIEALPDQITNGKNELFANISAISVVRGNVRFECDMGVDARDYHFGSVQQENVRLLDARPEPTNRVVSSNLARTLKQTVKKASNIIAIGSPTFGFAVNKFVSNKLGEGHKVFYFDGLRLNRTEIVKGDETRLVLPAMNEWEIGLSQNKKERGANAGTMRGRQPILLVCDQAEGNIVDFCTRLASRMDRLGDRPPILLLPIYRRSSPAAVARTESFLKPARIELLGPMDTQMAMSLAGEAGLVAILGGDHIPMKLLAQTTLMGTKTVIWSQNPFIRDLAPHFRVFSTPEDLVRMTWGSDADENNNDLSDYDVVWSAATLTNRWLSSLGGHQRLTVDGIMSATGRFPR